MVNIFKFQKWFQLQKKSLKTWKNYLLLKWLKVSVKKKISSKEATSFYLNRIEKLNPKLNAVIAINEDVLDQATQKDQKGVFDRPLEGVPILVKDMFCTQNIKTTAGSKILENFIPPEDATVISNLNKRELLF